MKKSDAIIHLDAALAELTLEAYRGTSIHTMRRADHFTIAEELRRVDGAIGPRGESMFSRIAEKIDAVYTEIMAARAAIEKELG